MTRIVLIRHTDEPLDDRVSTYLREVGVEPEIKRPFQGEALDRVDDTIAASVIFGGPFTVFEEERNPFLYDENRWIEQCIARNVPLLGICQGAQSIARVLGAHVGPKPGGPCEFGYYELTPTEEGRELFPDKLVVTQAHWHGFELPAGATLLAGSRMFPEQAFMYGPVTCALQFHPEVTATGFQRWQNAPWALYNRPGPQSRDQQDRLMRAHDAQQHRWFMSFLAKFLAPALARGS